MRSISERLVQTVATKTNANPLDLPSLYESINRTHQRLCGANGGGEISFEYAGVTVTVDSEGDIQVDEELLWPWTE